MSEQIDIAVDLGAVAAPLPEILTLRQLVETAPEAPVQIIEGVLHQGCKMILGGTSKSNKSWCLLDLALSVASGEKWWGRRCMKSTVVYINFELHAWAIAQRINALAAGLCRKPIIRCKWKFAADRLGARPDRCRVQSAWRIFAESQPHATSAARPFPGRSCDCRAGAIRRYGSVGKLLSPE